MVISWEIIINVICKRAGSEGKELLPQGVALRDVQPTSFSFYCLLNTSR